MATNHKDNDKPFRITVSGGTKLECAKRVIDLEKRGWECVKPIFEVVESGKMYDKKEDTLIRNSVKMKSNGAMFTKKHIAIMQKVEEVSEAS
ncbi:hypothetical protein QCQ60_005225 [Bacillus cereus]|nr:hypothetical protein [Bacillus cereus]